jgi:hypothetical protein
VNEPEGGPALLPTETRTVMPMDRDRPARIVPFAPDLLPAVRRFSERYWSRPRSDAYYDWRYLRSQPFSRMFLALQDDECLGLLSALLKQYRVGGRPTACLEVFDWHCLPGLRGSGIGIRLMRAMMRQPEPVISVGGTADVLATLPLMGWEAIGAARRYELPLSGGVLADRLQRRVGLPSAWTCAVLGVVAAVRYRPRRYAGPSASSVTLSRLPGDEIRQLYREETGYGFVQEPEPGAVEWLTDSTWSGRFDFLTFVLEGRLRGWVMTRTYDTEQGREASIIEVFASRPDVALYTWMVSEAVTSLMADRPRWLHARASCPSLQSALLANQFRAFAPDIPIHVWPKGVWDRAATLHITLNHSDAPLLPYASGKWASAKPPS